MSRAQNPYHQMSGPGTTWSRVNAAESAVGTQTPLSLTFWDVGGEMGFRLAYRRMGLIDRSGLEVPDEIDEQCTGFFYGKQAVNIDLFRRIFVNMPGVESVEEGVFATSGGQSMKTASTPVRRARARLGLIWAGIVLPRRLRRLRHTTRDFWLDSTRPGALGDVTVAKERLAEALRRFPEAVSEQVVAGTVAGVYYGKVVGLLAAVGRSDIELKIIGGYGHMSEIQLTKDLAHVARSGGDLTTFLSVHGFHGPAEGEMSSHSWREDARPVERMLEKYRELPPDVDPAASEDAQHRAPEDAEGVVLDGLSGTAKFKARVVLRLCRRYIPLRVEAKAAFTQLFDVARATARAIGDDWAKRGLIASADDIFFLTIDEIVATTPEDLRELIVERRRLRSEYERIELPLNWVGMPEPIESGETAESASAELPTLTAVGASHGVAEGVARVLVDANDPDALQPEEILVCHVTDPSWSAFFFVAAGVVIDIGGAMSHGAIVARELGIPCVINTVTGTQVIRSGDRVRVDGQAGTVQVLQRA